MVAQKTPLIQLIGKDGSDRVRNQVRGIKISTNPEPAAPKKSAIPFVTIKSIPPTFSKKPAATKTSVPAAVLSEVKKSNQDALLSSLSTHHTRLTTALAIKSNGGEAMAQRMQKGLPVSSAMLSVMANLDLIGKKCR